MSFSSKINEISRTRIDLIKIKGAYCSNVFGTSPCTAAGNQCYNTFPTCSDTANFVKTTKDYEFTNVDRPLPFTGPRPYVKSLNELPTEIKETTTVVRRLKVELADEPETSDAGIDPYAGDRESVQGTFWKKWIARNKNYKGFIVERYKGFLGDTRNDFQLVFAGRIDNITLNKGSVTIEAVDLMKALTETKYPLKSGVYLDQDLPEIFVTGSSEEMNALPAIIDDICDRTDFLPIEYSIAEETIGSLSLPSGYYHYVIVAYDEYHRPFAKSIEILYHHIDAFPTVPHFTWNAITNAQYYKVFGHGDLDFYDHYLVTVNPEFIDYTGLNWIPGEMPPDRSFLQYKKGEDGWYEYHGNLSMVLNDTSLLNASGYISMDKEIIYYKEKNVDGITLNFITRHCFDTESPAHEAGTAIYILLSYSPGNPFTILKDMLLKAGNVGSYYDSQFDIYEAAYNGPLVSLDAVFKETNLGEIYFDLVSLMDCLSWHGEDGKIKIVKQSELPESYVVISDDANIINNSTSIDLNEPSRKTRWGLYWNRVDSSKGLKDKDAYNRLTIDVDYDAEGVNSYGDTIEDFQYTAFLNLNSDGLSKLDAYILDLLTKRKNRNNKALQILNCEVEMKDSAILTGQLIKVSTDELQYPDGNNFFQELFRVIKREEVENKIKLKLLRYRLPESAYEIITEDTGQNIITEDTELNITADHNKD